jgi:head-tail adaptor
MYNKLCNVYVESTTTDDIGGIIKSRTLLYREVPCRTRHLTAEEVNANGAERGRQTHRIYLPYARAPNMSEVCRITLPDGEEFDVSHADNVDLQNCFWEIDACLASGSNCVTTWPEMMSSSSSSESESSGSSGSSLSSLTQHSTSSMSSNT